MCSKLLTRSYFFRLYLLFNFQGPLFCALVSSAHVVYHTPSKKSIPFCNFFRIFFTFFLLLFLMCNFTTSAPVPIPLHGYTAHKNRLQIPDSAFSEMLSSRFSFFFRKTSLFFLKILSEKILKISKDFKRKSEQRPPVVARLSMLKAFSHGKCFQQYYFFGRGRFVVHRPALYGRKTIDRSISDTRPRRRTDPRYTDVKRLIGLYPTLVPAVAPTHVTRKPNERRQQEAGTARGGTWRRALPAAARGSGHCPHYSS